MAESSGPALRYNKANMLVGAMVYLDMGINLLQIYIYKFPKSYQALTKSNNIFQLIGIKAHCIISCLRILGNRHIRPSFSCSLKRVSNMPYID